MPTTINVGDTMSDRHLAIYERLLKTGILPRLDPISTDTSSSYLTRCFEALCQRYADTPFDIEIDDYEEDRLERSRRTDKPVRFGAFIRAEGCIAVFNFHDFDRATSAHNRDLAANLLHHLSRATHYTFDAIGPSEAFNLAEWNEFHGCADDWWDGVRSELEYELGEEPSNAQVRHHIQTHQMRTPGRLRRDIGAHHARLHKHPKRLVSIERCDHLIDTLPTAERNLAHELLKAASDLNVVRDWLGTSLTNTDRDLFTNGDQFIPMPGLIFETSANHHVYETVDEVFQQVAQADGFGVNYAIELKATDASGERFAQTLARLVSASRALDRLATAVAIYNEE